MDDSKPPAIGIDLGTTYSCVAVYQYGMVEVIDIDQGNKTMPSFVSYTDNETLIGKAAKDFAGENPENTIFDAKRLIGRNFDEESVQKDIEHFTFRVVNERNKPSIQVKHGDERKNYLPEEVSAKILRKIKQIAEDRLDTEITDAVITVPAHFNDSQRKATKDAGELAGLNVLRIINEPTAAAIAYGLDQKTKGEKNVLIFDLGGGTFDVSILTIVDGVLEVKSTNGDTHLGGEDFDSLIVTYFVNEITEKHELDISDDKRAIRKLRTACEQAKIVLSSATRATIEIDNLFNGKDYKISLTRTVFEQLCKEVFQKTLDPVETALNDAAIDKEDIHDIVLVGGSTRIPKIRELIQNFFDGRELNTRINADEAVAYGAAVQAAILNGTYHQDANELVLLDVASLSLGIQTEGGKMEVLIPRNTCIPFIEKKLFSTTVDNQTSVLVQVYEGERPISRENNLLGRFQLKNIPKAPRRVPKIEVSFSLDQNGILNVSAKDMLSHNSNEITINQKDNCRLTKEQIAEKVRQAKAFEEQDKKFLEKLDSKKKLNEYCSFLKSTLTSDNVRLEMSEADQEQIKNKLEEILSWIEENDESSKDEFENKLRELKAVTIPVIEKFKNRNLNENDHNEDEEQEREQENENDDENRNGPEIEEIE